MRIGFKRQVMLVMWWSILEGRSRQRFGTTQGWMGVNFQSLSEVDNDVLIALIFVD